MTSRPTSVASPVTSSQPSRSPGHAEPVASAPAPQQARPRINLHIDRLTLEGVSRAETKLVVSELRQKLETSIASNPSIPWRTSSAALRIETSDLPPGASPRQIGQHLANQILRGLVAPNRRTHHRP